MRTTGDSLSSHTPRRLVTVAIGLALGIGGLALPSTVSAVPITYTATLLGSNEVPPTGSPATGSITVTLNGDFLFVGESFSNLTAPAIAAHIHCCAPIGVNAGVAVPFTGFPNAVSGLYNNSGLPFDLTLASTYNGSFITANGGTAAGAEAALITGLNSGQAYANIHDATFPGGEIRGQLAVPEPASLWLVLTGLIGLVAWRWKTLTA